MNEARENNMLRRWLLEPIPTLDREEAIALFNTTKEGVDERIDFNVMMLLATTLAGVAIAAALLPPLAVVAFDIQDSPLVPQGNHGVVTVCRHPGCAVGVKRG